MHKANLHTYNPVLFKAINDEAKFTEYKGTWTREQFYDFFMNKKYSLVERPSLDQLV